MKDIHIVYTYSHTYICIWLPAPVFLPGKSHGERSLAGYSPWGHKKIRHGLVAEQQQQGHTVSKRQSCHVDPAECIILLCDAPSH